ncbi:MAG: winged helix-turn-helix transcriptional regulator [Syntrophomonadaceae bacterium]|nr:winged helix-turn-helix transcriptional regulator [Syntrophomonadaceae bacterium]
MPSKRQNELQRQNIIIEIIKNTPNVTLQQIAEGLGLKSVSTVHVHINKLINENFIVREGRKLIPTNRDVSEFTPLPFYGYAQCGDNDIFAEENIVDYISMPTRVLPIPTKDLFLMKAKGDSMEPTISDGELLLFKKTNELPSADSIVLCRKDEGLKIKRIRTFNSEEGPKLQMVSDNKLKYEPFDCDESVRIYAKLVKMA